MFSETGQPRKINDLALAALIYLTIFIPGHMYNWALERAYVAVVFVVLLGFLYFGYVSRNRIIDSKNLLLIFGTITLLQIAGYLYSMSFLVSSTGVKDYIEMMKFPIQMVFSLFILSSFGDCSKRNLDKSIYLATIFSIFVFVVYFIKPPIIYDLMANFIYKESKTRIGEGIYRIAAPFENPNFFGFFLNIVFVYELFFSKKIRPLLFAFILMAIFLTGSRSAWITTMFVMVVYYFYACTHLNRRTIVPVISIPLMIMGVIIYAGDAITKMRRVMELLEAFDKGKIGNVESASARFAAYQEIYEQFLRSPLMGWGSFKYELGFAVDNQVLSYLLTIGVLGTLCIFLFLGMLFWRHWAMSCTVRDRFGLVAFWGGVFVMLQTGAFLENYRLYFLFIVFVAAIACAMQSAHDNKMERAE